MPEKRLRARTSLKKHMRMHVCEHNMCQCPLEGCSHTYTTVFNLQSHILSFHEERHPLRVRACWLWQNLAMKQSLSRHGVVWEPDKKKIKVSLSCEKWSLAFQLSGYLPPKRTQGLDAPLPRNGEPLSCMEGYVLSTSPCWLQLHTQLCCVEDHRQASSVFSPRSTCLLKSLEQDTRYSIFLVFPVSECLLSEWPELLSLLFALGRKNTHHNLAPSDGLQPG